MFLTSFWRCLFLPLPSGYPNGGLVCSPPPLPAFSTWWGSFLPAVIGVTVHLPSPCERLAVSHTPLQPGQKCLIHISTFNSIFFPNGFTNKFLYSCVRAHALLRALDLGLFMLLFDWWHSMRPGTPMSLKKACSRALTHKALLFRCTRWAWKEYERTMEISSPAASNS